MVIIYHICMAYHITSHRISSQYLVCVSYYILHYEHLVLLLNTLHKVNYSGCLVLRGIIIKKSLPDFGSRTMSINGFWGRQHCILHVTPQGQSIGVTGCPQAPASYSLSASLEVRAKMLSFRR